MSISDERTRKMEPSPPPLTSPHHLPSTPTSFLISPPLPSLLLSSSLIPLLPLFHLLLVSLHYPNRAVPVTINLAWARPVPASLPRLESTSMAVNAKADAIPT